MFLLPVPKPPQHRCPLQSGAVMTMSLCGLISHTQSPKFMAGSRLVGYARWVWTNMTTRIHH